MAADLSSERFALIKRTNGDDAVLRMLVAAQKKGASAQDIVTIAKDIGVGPTNLARLKAQVGWTPDRRKVARDTTDRRTAPRALDRTREKKAIRSLLSGTDEERASFAVYALTEDQADILLQLFSAYGGQKLEIDDENEVLFLIREADAEEHLWLASVVRATGEAARVGQPLQPTEIAGHVDEETFAELFPKAPNIDNIDADEVLPILAQGAKPFDL